jgi:predicted glycoside hydrolase/deacetylase ChbG (UPF0249 family)
MRIATPASLTISMIVLLVAGCHQDQPPTEYPPPRRSSLFESAPTVAAAAENDRDVEAKGARYLIIHADDAGLCSSVNRATIEAMERGLVSSVSMMVPCPAFEEFAEYAREHPEGDYGIHLTLNAEFKSHRWGPVLPADQVPGLVDPQGYLWAEEKQTAANAKADEVERELSAQIDRALALKVPISHLDSHMGTVFVRPDLTEVYVNLGIKYKLPVLFLRSADAFRMFSVFRGNDRSVRQINEKLAKERLPVLESLAMHYVQDTQAQRFNQYQRVIRGLPAGVSELIVHCGYADSELYAVTGSAGMRDADRRVLLDPRMKTHIDSQRVRIINWKQFREMAQSNTGEAPTGARLEAER